MKQVTHRLLFALFQGSLCLLLIGVIGYGPKAKASNPPPVQCSIDLSECESDCSEQNPDEQAACYEICDNDYSECSAVGSGSTPNQVCERLCFKDVGVCEKTDTPQNCTDDLTQCLDSCLGE